MTEHVQIEDGGSSRGRPVSTGLDRVHAVLLADPSGASHPLTSVLQPARERADLALAAGGHAAEAEASIVLTFAGDALVALAADGELAAAEVKATVAELAGVLGVAPEATAFMLFGRAIASPQLFEILPLTAIGIQLRLLVDLSIFREISLWRLAAGGETECLLSLGSAGQGGDLRREARAVLRGRSVLRVAGRSAVRSAPVWRAQQRAGAIVGRIAVANRRRAEAFLQEAARAIGPILEREVLLEPSRVRENSSWRRPSVASHGSPSIFTTARYKTCSCSPGS